MSYRGLQTGVDNGVFLNTAISTACGCRERELAAAYSQSKELTYSLYGEHAVLPLLHYGHTKLRRAAQDFVFLQGLLQAYHRRQHLPGQMHLWAKHWKVNVSFGGGSTR